jgi:methylglutaconyl-CoA hydratase
MINILYEIRERIAYITLNRPEKRNALSHELISELKVAFKKADEDDEVKVVVLAANGDAFCAGADLEYIQQMQTFSYEQNYEDSTHLKDLFLQIYEMKKVVIGQVQGSALAGGCGLVTLCDFVFAAPHAKFGYTEVRIGFIPAIVMVFLLRKIGETKGKELLLSGALITAEEAKLVSIINAVIPAQKLSEYVFDFASILSKANSGYSMTVTKQMIAKVQALPLNEALTFASEMNAKARSSEDCQRGIAAFLNKEKITW